MKARKRAILCGDSILDNDAYVGPSGRPLLNHLQEFLSDWAVDFRALDGAICSDVIERQLMDDGLRADAVVISAGGNDALGHVDLLSDTRRLTFLDFGCALAEIQTPFRADYRRMLAAAQRHSGNVLVLTIYRPRFSMEGMPQRVQRAAEALLSVFNDVIVEEALRGGHDVLDIRKICTTERHYANAIEPSDFGGREIAGGIAERLHHLRH